ncbi:hypothetical protein FVEN_g8843 [Fusarium venenatum]|uniref:Uncharacterized protein n=1 Tax=Fusarium venenatum TaxID=56646 RepID=A0A2L2TXS9_9HYPO|nr:uncharacterized protein FVRRES_02097 [Fusarium venenatum]KAG8353269.1 hypothetical protein FVEN_g8843 [Fusarium venenatum]CEI65585.1 unnamed protein product [Fusarium venenatum]
MSAQRLDALDRFCLKKANIEIAKLEEDVGFLKRRAATLGCYHKRFPEWPETPSQFEHIQAFIDLLNELGKKGGNSFQIAELKCDLHAQLRKHGCGESEVQHRWYLAIMIQRAVDATISGLHGQIVEFEDDRKRIEKELSNPGNSNTMPTVVKE